MEQFATFYLNETLLGLPIPAVREINPHFEITQVPLAPEFIRGLVNLRGQVVTVIDLGIKLGLGKREIQEQSRLMIIKTNAELSDLAISMGIKTSDDPVGLLIDEIGDVVTAEKGDIEPPPANMDISDLKYVRGVAKTKDTLLTLLNLNQLLLVGDNSDN